MKKPNDPAIELARHPVGSPRFLAHATDDTGTVYEPVVIVAHFVKHEQCPQCNGHCRLGMPGTGAPPCPRCDARGHVDSAFLEVRRAMGGVEVRRPEQVYGTLWVERGRGHALELEGHQPGPVALALAAVELIQLADVDAGTDRAALLREVGIWLGEVFDQNGTPDRSERTRATSAASPNDR